MSATYAQLPIRLEADLISQPPVVPVDANTGLPIQFWARQGISVQVGIFDAALVGVDLSNLQYLQLVLQESQGALVPTVTKTVLAGALITYITREDWLAGRNQNASFVFSDAETDVSLDGANEATYWLALQGKTTGNATITYAAGPVRIFNPGPAVPAPSTGLVSFHQQNSGGGNLVVAPTAQIHTEEIVVSGAAETRDVIVQATGLEAGAQVGLLLQLPATDGLAFRIFDQSLAGTLLTTVTCDASGFTPAAKVNLVFNGANFLRDTLVIPAFGQQN